MNTAEQIYQEAKDLPEALGVEVLDFIGYLKSRRMVAPEFAADEATKIAELEAFFASFQVDMSGFRFDRDEANER